ncbi:MAG: HisA/HisF-related TIM barrel protein, partial [Brachybacterium tyrofermentans]
GCQRYVVTDVTKDGTLRGPNVDLLRDVCSRTDAAVVASGGISSLEDLRALRELVPAGVEGAIVGKALYAQAFTMGEALDVAGRR